MSGDVNVRITATDEASGTFRAISAEAVKFGGIVGASIALADRAFSGLVEASTRFMRATIADANSFQDLSERTGIAVEKLAAYKLIADQSGTTISTIESALKMLSVSMAKNGDQFKKVGIDTQDANKAFRQLADLFVAMPNGAEKTALVMKLLGRAGQDLVPVLNQGSKGIEEAEEKSRRYIDAMKTLTPLLDKYADQQAEIGINLKASAAAIATGFMPEIIALSEKFVVATRSGDGLKKVLQELAELTGGGTSVFSLAARGVDAYYLFGGGGDPSKRSASGMIGGALKLPGGNSPSELAARKTACTLYGGTWDAASNTCKLKKPSGAATVSGPIDALGSGTYLTRDKETAKAIKESFDFENWAWGELAKDQERAIAEVLKYDEALKGSVATLYAATDPGRFETFVNSVKISEEAFARGFINQDQLDVITDKLFEVKEVGEDTFDKLSRAVEGWGRSASDSFAKMAVGGKISFADLGSFFNSTMEQMISLSAHKLLFDPMFKDIDKLLSSGNGGSSSGDLWTWIKSAFPFENGGIMTRSGPLPLRTYATGGIANTPQLALFGEGRMNEAYVPLPDGRSIPVTMRDGGKTNITMNFNINSSTGDKAEIRRSAAAGARAALGLMNGARRYG